MVPKSLIKQCISCKRSIKQLLLIQYKGKKKDKTVARLPENPLFNSSETVYTFTNNRMISVQYSHHDNDQTGVQQVTEAVLTKSTFLALEEKK